MKSKILEKVKDSLIITRIRLVNFIKEHKYVSAVIGLFLISAVVALAVNAEDVNYEKTANISDPNISVTTTIPNSTVANNFSVANYIVSYSFSNTDDTKILDEVEIKLELEDDYSYAKWQKIPGEEGISVIEGKTITITQEQVKMSGNQTVSVPLMVLNAPQTGATIKLSKISVKAGSEASGDAIKVNDNLNKTITTRSDKTTDLSVLAVSGIARKNNNGGRDAKYGLIIGYNNSPIDSDSLEGYYINNLDSNNNLKVYLKASGEDSTELPLITENDSYGIYNENKHYFNNFPILSLGNVGELTKKSTVPAIELLDNEVLHFEKQTGRFEYVSKVKINGEAKDCTSDNNCEIEGLNNVQLNSTGSYEITYKLTDRSNASVKQTIVVDDVASTKNYVLSGPKSFKYYGSNVLVSNFTNLYNIKKRSDSAPDFPITIEYYKGTNRVATCEYAETESSTQGYSCTGTQNFDNDSTYTQKIIISNPEEGNTDEQEEIERQFTIVSSAPQSQGENYYELPINNIVLSNLSKNEYNGLNALGSYYVTVRTTNISGDYKIYLQASANKDNLNTAEKVMLQTKTEQTGTNSAENDIYVNESDELVKVESDTKSTALSGDYYTASVGEKVEVISSFHYGLDADNPLTSLIAVINVDDNLKPTALVEDIGGTENFYDVDVDTIDSDKINSVVEFCTTEAMTESDCFDIPSDDKVIRRIKVVLTPKEGESIQPGSTIKIRTNYIVKKPENLTTNSKFNSTVIFNNSNAYTASSKNVYITPYKLRGAMQLGKYDKENEEFVSGADISASTNKTYTLSSTIDVTSPIMERETSAFGYNQIDKVSVIFTLPRGVMYISNDNYQLQPDINGGVTYNQDGTTTLKYTYVGVEPNSWYDQILFDFTVDVALANDTKLVIQEQIGNLNDTSNKNDLSSSRYKLLEREITIVNPEDISYGQYIYNSNKTQLISSIAEDSEFILKTKLYNANGVITTADSYTILPYNDEGESSYNGNYSIKFESGLDNALCSDVAPNELKGNLKSNANWKSCDEFKNGDWYSGVTAVKTSQNFTTLGEVKEGLIRIKPSSNESLATYKFNSYVYYVPSDGNEENEKHTFEPVKITVISKTITGVVWEDFDENGLMDDDEKRIDSVTLHLYNEDGTEAKESVMPNKKGVYSFTGLETGKYYVVAEFNNDKYGYVESPSNYHDASKISVFIADSAEVIKTDNTNDNTDDNASSQTPEQCEEDYEDCNQACDDDDEECVQACEEDYEDCESSKEPSEECDPDNEECEEEPSKQEETSDKDEGVVAVIKTGLIEVNENTRIIRNINLGLSLKKKFQPKLNKYITRAEVTNALGIVTRTDFGNTKLAKLNVKNMNNLNIKIVYTLEIENVKYYPGYIKLVTETIPEGMAFNENYAENEGWILHEDGTITNSSLANTVINEGEKKYLTIAFDLTSKEAGSFVNLASVDEFEVLGGKADED